METKQAVKRRSTTTPRQRGADENYGIARYRLPRQTRNRVGVWMKLVKPGITIPDALTDLIERGLRSEEERTGAKFSLEQKHLSE